MRNILLFTFLAINVPTVAQKMYAGSGTFDHQKLNMISIHFKEDIGPFLKSLQDRNNADPKGAPGIRWVNLKKPEWAEGKILVRILAVNPKGEQVLFISCVSQSGQDLLTPKTESYKIIKRYFKALCKTSKAWKLLPRNLLISHGWARRTHYKVVKRKFITDSSKWIASLS